VRANLRRSGISVPESRDSATRSRFPRAGEARSSSSAPARRSFACTRAGGKEPSAGSWCTRLGAQPVRGAQNITGCRLRLAIADGVNFIPSGVHHARGPIGRERSWRSPKKQTSNRTSYYMGSTAAVDPGWTSARMRSTTVNLFRSKRLRRSSGPGGPGAGSGGAASAGLDRPGDGDDVRSRPQGWKKVHQVHQLGATHRLNRA
jgi:hypothetical protein